MHMRNFIIGGLAVAGGLYLAKSATCYVLTKYKKEIREYVIDKVNEDDEKLLTLKGIKFAVD